MAPNQPTLEYLLHVFRTKPGMYFLGAGASSGLTPFGTEFMSGAGLDFVGNANSFSASIPDQPLLNRKIIAATERVLKSRRSGSRRFAADDLLPEILQRLPEAHARLFMMHVLANPLHSRRPSDNYAVFQAFKPSLLLNYNHDGLATDRCDGTHEVIEMHGSIHRGLGSPAIVELIKVLRESSIRLDDDDILLCVPESHTDTPLVRRLLRMTQYNPEFVALVGYSFARTETGHDDHVSLDYFQCAYRGFCGPVYVLDPHPEYLCDMLADRLKSRNVIGVRAYWNALSHAFMQQIHFPGRHRSINYRSEQVLDRHGDQVVFPLP
jgi:hypothetical protein